MPLLWQYNDAPERGAGASLRRCAMNLSGLLPLIGDISAYQELLAEIRQGEGVASLSLLRSARPYLVAALAQDLQAPILLLVARPEQVTSVVDQLRHWLPHPQRILRRPVHREMFPQLLIQTRYVKFLLLPEGLYVQFPGADTGLCQYVIQGPDIKRKITVVFLDHFVFSQYLCLVRQYMQQPFPG